MKKNTTSIAIASIFAFTALFAAAATYQDHSELGNGAYSEQASFTSPYNDHSELGDGAYSEQASFTSPYNDHSELGDRAYSEQA
jgi:hypothetical protein